MPTFDAHRARCLPARSSLSRGCFSTRAGGAAGLPGAICQVATVVPHRGTLPVRSLRPKALALRELGDPAQSCGGKSGRISRLRFSIINFRASQKVLSGDRTTWPGPIPFSLCSSGGPSSHPLSFLVPAADSKHLPGAQFKMWEEPSGCNPWLSTPKSFKRMAVCPGKKKTQGGACLKQAGIHPWSGSPEAWSYYTRRQ